MQGLNGLPLSDDLIERILIFSPSFSSLLSTILASKSFYEVYKTHPKSILRAVAYNITGPALPQALRLIRYRVPDSGSGSSDSNSETEDEDEGAGDEQEQGLAYETDEKAPITPKEARKIVKNAEIVNELEDLWSFRYKDRTSRQSKLTSTESWHFRRAIYRIMLYNRIFSVRKYVDAHDVDTGSLGGYDPQLEKIKRTKYLSQFFTDELLQIHSVGTYLMEILEYADDDEPEGHDTRLTRHLAFCVGPECVLECYREVSLGPVHDAVTVYEDEWGTDELEMFEGYLTYPISKVLEKRKVKQPPEDFTHWHSISSEVNGKNDECDRCHESAGFKILCRLNWVERSPEPGYLINLFIIETLFKGLLPQNPVERTYWNMEIRALDEQCREQDTSTNWLSTIMNDIFDDKLLRPEFEDWTKDDYLCDKCLKKLLREHLWVWLLEHKKTTGVQIAENCWYGYNCRTQRHKLSHAQRLNHLCEPTRGDGPQ